jgi:hypothetical protein
MSSEKLPLNRLESKLRLTLTIASDHIVAQIWNISSQAIRLWELGNSWGWEAYTLQFRSALDGKMRSIKRAVRDWTKNGPVFFVLSAGKSREVDIDLHDGWWERDADLARLQDEPMWVRVIFTVNLTPEAEEYGVGIGTVVSDWVVSSPPHRWLFVTQ